jgi:hypothetical protein
MNMKIGLSLAIVDPKGSGVIAALNEDFTNGAVSLDPLITFSRASSATYFDSAGVLQTAGSGVARAHAFQDYNPSTLAPLGFLIEEQRTNLIITSGDLASANWAKLNCTQSAIAAAKGFPFAFSLQGNAGSSLKILNTAAAISITAGAVYTAWAVVSYDDCRYISFTFDDGATANGVWTAFDLSLGTISRAAVAYGTGASAASTITAIGGGLYFITITGTAGTVATLARWAISQQSSGTTQFNNFDTTTKYKFYHAQLELGAFRTSAIHTTGTAATRLADSASITGTNFSQWYNQTEGTFVSKTLIAWNIGAADFPSDYQASDGTGSNRMVIGAGNNIGLYGVTVGGVIQVELYPAESENIVKKRAFAYKLNDYGISLNGGAATTDTSATVPTVNKLNIGAWSNDTVTLNGWVSSLAYFRTRLPNATLASLST